MSKKKSYMDIKNIIKEDIFSAFFRGLFGKKYDASKKQKKIKKKMQTHVDTFNRGVDAITADINKMRKARGAKPKKANHLTVKDFIKSIEK